MVVFASESITSWLSLPPHPRYPRTSRSRPSSRSATAISASCSGSARASRSRARGRSPAAPSRPERRSRRRSSAISRRRSTCARSRTSSNSARGAVPTAIRIAGSSRPRTSASCRSASTLASPTDTSWHTVDALPETAFDHGAIVLAGRDRLRGKLSYSNIGFALASETFTLAELRDVYEAALGYDLSSTNLKRVLAAARRDRGRRQAPRPRAGGRAPRRAVPLPRPTARGDRPVRRPASSGLGRLPCGRIGTLR